MVTDEEKKKKKIETKKVTLEVKLRTGKSHVGKKSFTELTRVDPVT